MRILESNKFWFVVRILSGFIIAYAGLMKLLEPAANFEAVLLKYGIFSPFWIPWMARVLPWVEWILGSFLIAGYAPRLSASGVSLLCLAFLVTLGSSRLFLESGGTDCGCFGQSGPFHLTLRQIFVVDLINFAVTLRLAFMKNFLWSLDQFLLKRLP